MFAREGIEIKPKRHDLKKIAEETRDIVLAGKYIAPNGKKFFIEDELDRASKSTRIIERHQLFKGPLDNLKPKIEVAVESSLEAAKRLAYDSSPNQSTVILNFASAKNPGGGWLRGCDAQEESLCRASNLASCLEGVPYFYEHNRNFGSNLYSDLLIHSNNVVFFRDDSGQLLDEPYRVSVITSPAPNRGAIEEKEISKLKKVLRNRTRDIVRFADQCGYTNIILGAWGCGIFRNDPAQVANAFRAALDEFPIENVTFAILGPESFIHDEFRKALE